MKHRNHQGFTIVELLIVIVVIGILAAITVVAYNGVQERALTTAVRNDLNNIGKALQIYHVDNGSYPPANQTGLQGLIKPTKSAYPITVQVTMSYCRTATDFSVYARQGNTQNSFVYSNLTGLKSVAPTGNRTDQCQRSGIVYTGTNPEHQEILLHGGSGSSTVGWQSWI